MVTMWKVMQLTHNVSYFRKPHPKGDKEDDLWFELPKQDSDHDDQMAKAVHVGDDSTDEQS